MLLKKKNIGTYICYYTGHNLTHLKLFLFFDKKKKSVFPANVYCLHTIEVKYK